MKKVNLFLQKISVALIFFFSGILGGLDAANVTAICPFLEELLGKDDEDLLQKFAFSYIVGSIMGCIGFCLTVSSRKIQMIVADLGLIFGYFIMFSIKKEIGFCVGRGLVGMGITLLTLSGPLAVNHLWPNGSFVLASAGFCFQLGQAGSDLINWMKSDYLLLSTGLITCIQLMLVSLTKKEAFQEGQDEAASLFSMIRNGKFLKGVFSATLVQSTMILVGLKPTSYLGPKIFEGLPTVSAATSLVASIMSMIFVKIFKIKRLLFSTLLLMCVELAILGYFIEKKGGTAEFITSTIFSVYVFTYVCCFSSAPLIYSIRSFGSDSRGLGLGFVGLLSETLMLAVNFFVDEVKLKVAETKLIWSIAGISVVLAFLIKFLIEDPADHTSPTPAKETVNSSNST